MLKNLLIGLVTAALVTASAATYRVTLFQPSVVNGTELAPGDYKLELKDTQVVLSKGKATAQAGAAVVHGGNGRDCVISGEGLPAAVHHAKDGAGINDLAVAVRIVE